MSVFKKLYIVSLHAAVVANQSVTASTLGMSLSVVPDRWICTIS